MLRCWGKSLIPGLEFMRHEDVSSYFQNMGLNAIEAAATIGVVSTYPARSEVFLLPARLL